MKGFKKNGKFIPTETRKKSSLTKSDVKKHQFEDDRIGKTLPISRRKESLDERKPQKEPYSQVAIWGSTVVGEDKKKEFEEFMKSEYGVRVNYLEEIKTFPDKDQNGSNVEGTGGRNDVFFSVHEGDIPKFAVKRLGMDPPVRWIEDVIANEGDDESIYPETVKEYRTWEA